MPELEREHEALWQHKAKTVPKREITKFENSRLDARPCDIYVSYA